MAAAQTPIEVVGRVTKLGGARVPRLVVELTTEDAQRLGRAGALYGPIRVVLDPPKER